MKISAFPPGGLGPWFCALLFNASPNSKKQTHIFVHTYPHLALDSFNRTYTLLSDEKKRARQSNGECWIMILKIGPFESWQASTVFLEMWSSRTRGKSHRMERGLELFHQSGGKLHMWFQGDPRDCAVAAFFCGAAPANCEKYLVASADGPNHHQHYTHRGARGGKHLLRKDKSWFSLDEEETRDVLDELEKVVARDEDPLLLMGDVVALHEHEANAMALEKKRLKLQ